MKTDEFLYEYLDVLNEKEAKVIDDVIRKESSLLNGDLDAELSAEWNLDKEETNKYKRQKNLTMDKINAEIRELHTKTDKLKNDRQKKEKFSGIRLFGKRKFVSLVAVFVLLVGVFAFAKEQDWDIEMADILGLSGVMQELDGGYVKIGVCDTSDGITITATQGIGDKNSMWVQLDTDLDWGVGEDGYYCFEVIDGHWYKGEKLLTGSHQIQSFNNNGKVSFMWQFMGYEDINRARSEVYLSELRAYETLEDDDEGYIVSNDSWSFEWENCYAPNTVSVRPYEIVTLQSEQNNNTMDCLVTEIEISPVSMWVFAWKSPFEKFETSDDMVFLSVESFTLVDGSTIVLQNGFSSAGSSNFRTDCFLNFENMKNVDVNEIDYVTIGGKKISIKK